VSPLNEQQFGDFTMKHEVGSLEHSIYAFHPSFGGGDIPAGSMHWYHSPGKKFGRDMAPGDISHVEVQGKTKYSEGFRGQGLASAMYGMANNFEPKPRHVPEQQTTAGQGWAAHVGGA
jgi:hypothetical protein